jgi:outer membrane protein assembly factor BamA
MNMKAVVFYDGGTGFDNPYVTNVDKRSVTGNNFDYRHAIGIGIRVLQPMPVNIDWGFKIDPRKNKLDPRLSETASEIHFGMSYDW